MPAACLNISPVRWISPITARPYCRMAAWYGPGPVLAMYGTDHSAPLPWLSRAVEALLTRSCDVHYSMLCRLPGAEEQHAWHERVCSRTAWLAMPLTNNV